MKDLTTSEPLPLPRRQTPQPQRIELDKTFRVALVVGAGIVLEGDQILRIERVGAVPSHDDDVALVELESPHQFRRTASSVFVQAVFARVQPVLPRCFKLDYIFSVEIGRDALQDRKAKIVGLSLTQPLVVAVSPFRIVLPSSK